MSAGTETHRQPAKQPRQLAALEGSPAGLPGLGIHTGTATMSASGAGFVVVAATYVKATSHIFVSYGAVVGPAILHVDPGLIVPGVSFRIDSSGGGGDTSQVEYLVVG
jgi:hypothetical protein